MFTMLLDALGVKPEMVEQTQRTILEMGQIAADMKAQLDRIEAHVEFLDRAHDDPAAIRQDYSDLPSFDTLAPNFFGSSNHSAPSTAFEQTNGKLNGHAQLPAPTAHLPASD
jgi:hypothetical protein